MFLNDDQDVGKQRKLQQAEDRDDARRKPEAGKDFPRALIGIA